jgi:hypothetical protein
LIVIGASSASDQHKSLLRRRCRADQGACPIDLLRHMHWQGKREILLNVNQPIMSPELAASLPGPMGEYTVIVHSTSVIACRQRSAFPSA